jgi:acetylornithine deacetylase
MRLLYIFQLILQASSSYATATSSSQQSILNSPSSSSSTSPLVSLHKSLVEYESITGNEHDVAQYLISYLQESNFTVETQDVSPRTSSGKSRENIFAYVGTTRQTRVLVSSHIDTVPPFWKYERKGDEIWGRGSVDAKGSVASQIIAVEELLDSGTIAEGDVALLFVVGEEVGGDGMKKANELGVSWESCIFGEPTELKLASGHKGIMSLDIKAKGKAGHSGYPQLGKSANSMIVKALYALLQVDLPSSEKYGSSTLNIGTIRGGVAGNVIAEDASATISLRIAAGQPAMIEKILLDAIEKTGEKLDVKFSGGYPPVYIDSDVPGMSDESSAVLILKSCRLRYDCCELWNRHSEPQGRP